MAKEETPYVYKTVTIHIQTTPGHLIFTVSPIPPDSKGERAAKALLTVLTLIVFIYRFRYLVLYMKKIQI